MTARPHRARTLAVASLALAALALPAAATEAAGTGGDAAEVGPSILAPLPSPPGTPKPSRTQVESMIDQVSKQYGVEKALVKAVVTAESNYNSHAVSRVGAVGLMQVMPATAGDYGVGSTQALFDPMTNLKTGTRHLKRLLDKYGNDYGRAIMAYNAGEGVVDRTGTNVAFQETLDYTEAVLRNYGRNGGTQPTHLALNKVVAIRGMRNRGRARKLFKRYLDPSLLSLKVKPTLSMHWLSPALHTVGPDSKPMFELGPEALR